jgi:hypothetical protein
MSANANYKDQERTRTQRLVLELAAVREKLEDTQRRASKPRIVRMEGDAKSTSSPPPSLRPSVRPPPTK